MKHLIIIGFILLLTNCTLAQNSLGNDKTIKESFTETEIQDLQLLYDFFNKSICNSNKGLNDCYKDFFVKVKQAYDTDSLYLHIPLENQQQIFNQINESTFKQIWSFGNSFSREKPNDTIKTIYFSPNGKFMKFLEKAGKNDEFINAYQESVAAAGVPTPTIISEIIMYYDKLNIEDIKVKFVIAIHYLYMNDIYRR